MLTTANYQRNRNQNYSEVPPHPGQLTCLKQGRGTTPSMGSWLQAGHAGFLHFRGGEEKGLPVLGNWCQMYALVTKETSRGAQALTAPLIKTITSWFLARQVQQNIMVLEEKDNHWVLWTSPTNTGILLGIWWKGGEGGRIGNIEGISQIFVNC